MEIVIKNEDHTLGHLLHQEFLKDSDVTFAGYTKSHPLENKITFKFLVKQDTDAKEIFIRSVNRIKQKLAVLKQN
jgi:DNA-directed RNA polymerase subunit L